MARSSRSDEEPSLLPAAQATEGPPAAQAAEGRSLSERRLSGSALLGAAVCLTYSAAHAWWALTGTPEFVRSESVFVGGWLIVGIAAVAAVVCLVVGSGLVSRWSLPTRWILCGIGWISSAGMAAYCLLWLPSVAQLLMVPFGETIGGDELATISLRLSGTSAALLTAVSTRGVLRDLRSACPVCGIVHGRAAEDRDPGTSWWGFLGGYLAVVGLIVRVIPAVVDLSADGWNFADEPGGWGFLLFLGLALLAGTLLPLALVHRWGRIWPSWVPIVTGRRVPRWIVHGPGAMISLGLLAYFGVGGVTAMALGVTSGDPMEAIEIGAYVLWGIGLATACVSYARLTRPVCASPKRQTLS